MPIHVFRSELVFYLFRITAFRANIRARHPTVCPLNYDRATKSELVICCSVGKLPDRSPGAQGYSLSVYPSPYMGGGESDEEVVFGADRVRG